MDFKILNEKAIKLNITDVEIYKEEGSGSNIQTMNKQVLDNTISQSNDMYIRGVYNNHISSIYVEKDTEDEIDNILNRIIENASVIESKDPFYIYEGSSNYPSLEKEENDYELYDLGKQTALLYDIEDYIREKCSYVRDVVGQIEIGKNRISIENSKGLNVSQKTEGAYIYISCVVEKDGEVKNGHYFEYIKKFSSIDKEEIYKKAVVRSLDSIGAKSIPTKNYKVVFENKMFSSLMNCFIDMFSAESVIKHISLLEGKLNEKVFGNNIEIVDDPLLKESSYKRTFDDEGVCTSKNVLVSNGVVKSYLHNLKTAKMMETKSTGNGYKESNGNVGVRTSNIKFKCDEISFDQMISGIDEGVFITSLMGQHAGVNRINGSFSLQASGFKITNGKIGEPVTLIIVSGNIVDVLNNIKYISNDFYVSSRIGVGSVLVNSLSISGK